MISVIIPTLNSERSLPRTLACLIPPTVKGLVREVIIVDGGSVDDTAAVAEVTGAKFLTAPRGRGHQLRAGGKIAKSEWLLFLHSDTVLSPEWPEEIEAFLERVDRAYDGTRESREVAGVFRFSLDDFRPSARRLEWWVSMRCRLAALPYGDQGLLISREFYDRLGGFSDMPLMEDVDMVRRIGRKRLHFFKSDAVTSADRYRKDGYVLRPMRNMSCLALYYLGVPPSFISRLYS